MKVPEDVKAGPLLHVPHTDTLVLGIGEDQLRIRMEENGRDVVVVSTASVHLDNHGRLVNGMDNEECTCTFNERVKCSVLTSQALLSLYLHIFTCRSSDPETRMGIVWWKATQFTPAKLF